jgi:nuclear transport factor 2 (NTF2) superfamily protein
MAARPPLPPFTRDTAIQKVRLAEDAWNSRDPEKVALAYTPDSHWRNRSEFIDGCDEIVAFLTRKWAKELEYRLIKELWTFEGTGSPSGSPTSITMTRATGSVPTATRTGSSTSRD